MKSIGLLLLLILVGCTNESVVDSIPGGSIVPDGNSTMITIKLPGSAKPVSYAATDEDENKVVEVDVLAFSNEAGVDRFNYRVQIDPSKIADASTAVDGNQKKINFVLRRQDKPVRLMVIANARALLDNATITADMSADEIMNQLTFENPDKWPTNPFKAFPMWGRSTEYFSVKDPVVESQRTITLLRSVAKIDVGIDVYGDPAIGFGSLFKLKSVRVYNVNNKGAVAPDLADVTGITANKVTRPNIPTGTGSIATPLVYSGFASDKELNNEIYVPELKVPASNNPNEAIFLIIGGSYNGGQETFFKVHLVNNQKELLPVLRNHKYYFNITGVTGNGALTVEDAFNGKGANLVYTLGVTNERIKDITFNGQYLLGVDKTFAQHNWRKTADDDQAGFVNVVAVATDYHNGWEATTETPWIRIENPSGPAGDGSSGIRYYLDDNVDYSAPYRKGIITIKAGLLEKKVVIKQHISPNSCIHKFGDPNVYLFPLEVVNINGFVFDVKQNTSRLSARVIWTDTPAEANVVIGVHYDDVSGQYISVKPLYKDVEIEQNILIGIFHPTSGKLLWTYHVWRTKDDPRITGTKLYKGELFMNRNMGAFSAAPGNAASAGLIYQWGRLTPFPGSVSLAEGSTTRAKIYNNAGTEVPIMVAEVDAENNLANAIENPTTFYTSSQFPYYNWYGKSESNNILWMDQNGDKSVYDPCPFGWRVPVSSTGNQSAWSGLTTAGSTWNAGYNWTNVGYYPAAGGYDFATGKLVDVGVRGYFWSAAPAGVKAYLMSIGEGSINVQSSGYRANGYPVRCVKIQDPDEYN